MKRRKFLMSDKNNKKIFEAEICEVCQLKKTKKILMVVTQADNYEKIKKTKTGLWLEEFAVPYLAFTENGYEVTTATPSGGKTPLDPESENLSEDIKWHKAKEALGDTQSLDTIDFISYDALVLPGGHGPMFDLYKDETLGQIINDFEERKKLIAAVCHGPAGLLSAKKNGIPFVNGKKLTCFTNEEEYYYKKENLTPFFLEDALKDAGAEFVKKGAGEINIIEDDNLITGQNFQSSKAFANAVINYLNRC